MRLPRFTRPLKATEIKLARSVYKGSLPPWHQIGITDGLGKGDTVWTHTSSMMPFVSSVASAKYLINFGDAANHDLSQPGEQLSKYVAGYPELMADVFIHELAHVWQYSQRNANEWSIAARCVYAQEFGAGYHFAPGAVWESYNLEQQASIVEKWSGRGRREDDVLFPYIHFLVRKEGEHRSSATAGRDRTEAGLAYTEYWYHHHADLAQLKVLLDMERAPVTADTQPVRVTVKDDSLVAVLDGDVLFDFDKANLKSSAHAALEQAWLKIKANPRRRLVYVNGHTDAIGDDAYNDRLSTQRAKAVAEWFYRRSYLAPSMVRVQGFGRSQPAAPNASAGGRAKNRRVEIFVING